MLKKSIALLMSVVICIYMETTTFAAENTQATDSGITASQLVEYLNSVDFGTDITFTEFQTARLSNNNLLKFDSIEAVEMYFQQLLGERQEFRQSMESNSVSETHSLNLTRASNGWKEGTVSWWGGGNTSLFFCQTENAGSYTAHLGASESVHSDLLQYSLLLFPGSC